MGWLPNKVRREARTRLHKFRGGKLAPVMAVGVRPGEGGFVSQNVTFELAPIAGRMITPITAELTAVFVPVQAIDAIKDPDADYAGMTEVVREKLLSGNPLFGLEDEGELSMRCCVNPRSIGGVKKVNEAVRLAHNAAVNHLRLLKYDKASQLLHSNTAMTPALLSETVLERMNAVLDPDDRINGRVELELGGEAKVRGIGIVDGSQTTPDAQRNEKALWSDSETPGMEERPLRVGSHAAFETVAGVPQVFADLSNVFGAGVSLVDFYNAEKQDELTRKMRQIVTDNKEYGEEMALRWAHGLTVDPGRLPFVISRQTKIFGRNIVGATDTSGVEGDVMRSDMMTVASFQVPIPRTELGGFIITFATVKPDETLSAQPHPILSDVWGLDNFVADELALDPVPVTVREMFSDAAAGDESTVLFYTGHNALKRLYVDYGLARNLDPTTVESKTALWQLEVPLSVTPESILYPEFLEHYPFADQLAEVVTAVVTSNVVFQTPMIFGPTPVETLDFLDTENLFEQEQV